MSRVPDITRGLGLLTPQLWRRLWNAVHWVEQNKPRLEEKPKPVNEPPTMWIPALLRGYQRASGNQFRYSWIEGQYGGGGVILPKTTGRIRSSTVAGNDWTYPAWNLAEARNGTTGFVSQVNIDGPDYPPDYYVQPIRGSSGGTWPNPGAEGSYPSDGGPCVILFFLRIPTTTSTNIQHGPVFWLQNHHDGLCPPPEP